MKKKVSIAAFVAFLVLALTGSASTWEIVKTLPSPPDLSSLGVTWDGSYLWVAAENPPSPPNTPPYEFKVFKLDPETGQVLSPSTYDQAHFSWPSNSLAGIEYDPATDEMYHLVFPNGPIYVYSGMSGLPPYGEARVLTGVWQGWSPDLTYDGTYLWVIKQPNTIYKVNPIDGQVELSFDLLPQSIDNVDGIAWDGEHLLIAHDGTKKIYPVNPDTFTVVWENVIDLTEIGINARRMDWDGQYLWMVGDRDGIYQIDITPGPTPEPPDQWLEPVNLIDEECPENEVHINTQYSEEGPSVTEDHNTLYFGSNRRSEGAFALGDIYVSHRDVERGCWGEPELLPYPVNSSEAWEGYPSISPDGTVLYFMSVREGPSVWEPWFAIYDRGTGNWDGPWKMPPPISTDDNDSQHGSISYDGNTFYFASNRSGTTASTSDVWKSEKVEGVWQGPENLGYPISTECGDGGPSISRDGSALYFESGRSESGECIWGYDDLDIFVSYWDSTDAKWGYPDRLSINIAGYRDSDPGISWDGTALYFTSNRDGGQGGRDVWVSYAEIEVLIDIKPGSDPNSINLGSGGVVPVAILSEADFDATSVDPMSVTLAGGTVRLRGQGTPQVSMEDVNEDGLVDLIVHVETQILELSEGATEAVLEGNTYDGIAVRGSDFVNIVP